jgi:hypothetical protein
MPLAPGQIEAHLRLAHRIYQFRGRRGVEHEIAQEMAAAVCASPPDQAAWHDLQAVARDAHPEAAESFLVAALIRRLRTLPEHEQVSILPGLAELLAAAEHGSQLLVQLCDVDDPLIRQLALLVVPRLTGPLEHSCPSSVLPLFARKQAPFALQVRAAAALLRFTGPEGADAPAVVDALLRRRGKAQGVALLQQLEKYAGPVAAIQIRLEQLENRIRMRCPRCRIQMRRPDMVKHLWTDHGLLLDGWKVRTPWRQIESWVRDFRRSGQPVLLDRCRELARKADPVEGMPRLQRLFLRRGIDDPEARQTFLRQAALLQATICPRCYGLVPTLANIQPRPLNQSHGRLSQAGYCAELSELGLVPQLLVELPGSTIHKGREPGRWLTRRGATLILAAPLVIAGLLAALFLPGNHDGIRWPVAGLLLLALLVYLGLLAREKLTSSLLDRAITHAWTLLAPRLHSPRFASDDSAFVAGLALSSKGRGQPAQRRATLERLVDFTEEAIGSRSAPLGHLAALKRLQIADMALLGEDPIGELARSIARCFDARVALNYADMLLASLSYPWWNDVNRARLRILLCDHAFEAGLENSDLIATGETAPVLGACLQINDSDGLARLRLLWSMRARCPWLSWSNPVSAFEMAARPEREASLLGIYPDLLLLDGRDPQLILAGRGVVLGGTVFTSAPPVSEVRPLRDVPGPVDEILVGNMRLGVQGEPREAIRRLQSCFRFAFEEFEPNVAPTYRWQAPNGPKDLHYEQAVRCQSCRCLLLPRPGDVGRRVDH